MDTFLKSNLIRENYSVFRFELDDIITRDKIAADTRFFISHIRSRAPLNKPVLCFVDEVQKSESVFDAIKMAWDDGINFIVSGSNPEYLETQAKKRLQRRSELFDLKPLSLPEILYHESLVSGDFSLHSNEQLFFSILSGDLPFVEVDDYLKGLSLSELDLIQAKCSTFLTKGGLPGAYKSRSIDQAFAYIRATVERGFLPILNDTLDLFDVVTVELASSSAKEFVYENFFQRTRIRKRNKINEIVNKLKGHGYIREKRPYIPDSKLSYFVIYSFIDPGMISYLNDTLKPSAEEEGHLIESYIHARLDNILRMQPRKTLLSYYKPYIIRAKDNKEELRFKPGEIDFVISFGARGSQKAMPIEVKRSVDISPDQTLLLKELIGSGIFKHGIVLYGGMPYLNKKENLLYWPWWLI